MRTIIVSAGVALILALLGTPLAILVFSRRRYGQLTREAGPAPHATSRGTPIMGDTVLVVASLIGYVVGHVLTRDPMSVSGVQVLGLMTGLGLVGFAGDFIKIHRHSSRELRSGAKLQGLGRLETGAAILALAAYVLIFNWQLRTDCTVLLTKNCYVVRDPLDLAVVAASVLGGCCGFLWWNARRARIFMGATGTLALGGALAGLAVTAHTQLLLAMLGGLFVIITLTVIRWADRLAIRALAGPLTALRTGPACERAASRPQSGR